MRQFLRAASLLLICSILFSMGACKPASQPEADPKAVFAALIQQVDFATELEDLGDSGVLYLPDLPQGATVQMYAGSAYFVDKVALVTVTKEADIEAAVACVKAHVAQLKDQYKTYIPEEVPKLEKAVIWQQGNSVILCICPDAEQVKDIIGRGASLETPDTQAATKPTTEPTTEPPTTEPSVEPPTTEPPTEPPTTEPPTEPPTTEPPTEPPTTEPPTEPPTTEPPTEPPTTEPPTEPPTTEPPVTQPPEYLPGGEYPALKSQSGTYSFNGTIYQVDTSAFEGFGYINSAATAYAGILNQYAQELKGISNVYALTIPTAIGVVLPDDIIAKMGDSYSNQGNAISRVFSNLSEDVIAVECYDNLMRHRNEYLYFKTDHHWTARGAYYAYEAFCETKGIAPYTLEQRKVSEFPGFKGYLHQYMSGVSGVTDTVYAYHPVCNVSMKFTDRSGNTIPWPIIRDVSQDASYNKYGTFAAGDNPFTEFHNADVTDGSVCIVIKESFGCAFMPFIVDHYSTVYEIDYRYWSGSLTELAKSVGAQDVIFANNIMRVCGGLVTGDLNRIF